MQHAVTWAQLEPALPPVGQAASVRAADFTSGFLRECLEDPSHALCAEAVWPETIPQGRVWVESAEEWLRICEGAARRGVFTFLRRDEIFHARGQPVLNGLFGIEKKGKLCLDPTRRSSE